MLLNRSVKWNNRMTPAILPTRQANITDDTDEPASRNENTETVSPDLVQLLQKNIVIMHGAQLIAVITILFECPVGGRRDDQAHGMIVQHG